MKILQTFRPKKKFEPGTLRYSLHKHAQASLSSGINLRTAVALPPGEDVNDWIAVHGKNIDFLNYSTKFPFPCLKGDKNQYCAEQKNLFFL